MAITTPSDVFVPQVVGDIATEINFAKTTLLNSGVVQDATGNAWESGGSTITFPKWTSGGTLGVQALPSDGSAITPDKITMDSDTATVNAKIVAFALTNAMLEDCTHMADPNAFMARVVAENTRADIQSALITEAETTTLSYTEAGAGLVTYDGLLESGVYAWGEKAWDEDVILVAHSNVVFDLLCTDEAKKTQTYGGPPTVTSGTIQRIAGKLVLPLDSVSVSGSGADRVYTNLLIRRDALQFYRKRALDYAEQRLANSDTWYLWWTYRYAVHLSADITRGNLGVVKYITNSSRAS